MQTAIGVFLPTAGAATRTWKIWRIACLLAQLARTDVCIGALTLAWLFRMLPGGLPTFGCVTLGMETTLCRSCAPTSDLWDTCARDRTDESSAIWGAGASQRSPGGEVRHAGHERPGITRDCTRSQGCSFLRWRLFPVIMFQFVTFFQQFLSTCTVASVTLSMFSRPSSVQTALDILS